MREEHSERASAAYDDEYIAPVEEYRSDNVSYERAEPDKPKVSGEFLENEFGKYLERGERILYVYGDGKGRSVNPMGLYQSKESGDKVGLAAGIIVFVCIILTTLMILEIIPFVIFVFITYKKETAFTLQGQTLEGSNSADRRCLCSERKKKNGNTSVTAST